MFNIGKFKLYVILFGLVSSEMVFQIYQIVEDILNGVVECNIIKCTRKKAIKKHDI